MKNKILIASIGSLITGIIFGLVTNDFIIALLCCQITYWGILISISIDELKQRIKGE